MDSKSQRLSFFSSTIFHWAQIDWVNNKCYTSSRLPYFMNPCLPARLALRGFPLFFHVTLLQFCNLYEVIHQKFEMSVKLSRQGLISRDKQ